MPDPFSPEIRDLFQTHFDHLVNSAISIDVIKERGYVSVLGKTALKNTGFTKSQQRSPGILIPLHGVDGSIVGHQYRPDHPREGVNNRLIKYENPTGATIRLDVPTRCREQLGNPKEPVWFTEGVKKVDALASQGVCAIGLTGVWGFKSKNIYGGTTISADFDYISLKNRLTYLVFDSDSASNPQVALALRRLTEHLERKGANVTIIQLPDGADGAKLGADDYLALGHTIEEMKTLEVKAIASQPRQVTRTTTQYDVTDSVFCWFKSTAEGISEIPLCNFTAKVVEDITRDNGLENNRYFKIEGKMFNGQGLPTIETPSAGFNSLNWVTAEWGIKPSIAAGSSSKDRLREAIQLYSKDARQRTIFAHTGWREIEGEMTFLHAAGALGRDDVEVEVEPALGRYQLLDPVGDPVEAIKKSLNFMLVAPLETTMPLWAAMYLAPLTEIIDTSFTVWLVGASGSFKSTLTALALCHFGTFDSRHLPASWSGTQNELERLLFLAKDLPFVIDDWAPGQDSGKAKELEIKAERVIRAQGNRQGRVRMKSDTSSQVTYIPRGLLLTSGEQLPSGHSHTARIFSVDIEQDEVDTQFLSTAQDEQYYYCVAMSHYINWIKKHFQELKSSLPRKWREYRDQAQEGSKHPRLPEVIAGLYCAMDLATKFAQEYGAISDTEAEAFKHDGWDIFSTLAARQSGLIEDERPSKRALELWRSMIDQGIAVLFNKDDDTPKTPAPGTRSIGWFENNNGASCSLLNPKAAYGALVEHGQRIGQPFTIKEHALWKDLKRMGYSECSDNRNTFSVYIYGKTMRVIKLKKL